MLRSRLLLGSVELSCSVPVPCWGLASSSRNETEGEMSLLASVGAPGRPGFQQEQGVNVNEPTKLGNMLWYVSQSSVLTMFIRSLPVGRLVLRFCKVEKPRKTTNHWWCTHQNWATSPFFLSRNHHLHPFFRLSLQNQVENIDTVNRPVVFFDYDPQCNAAPRDYSRFLGAVSYGKIGFWADLGDFVIWTVDNFDPLWFREFLMIFWVPVEQMTSEAGYKAPSLGFMVSTGTASLEIGWMTGLWRNQELKRAEVCLSSSADFKKWNVSISLSIFEWPELAPWFPTISYDFP